MAKKWYYAKMHVAMGDYIALPGEVIEGDLRKLDIDHLLRIGAICECSAPQGVPYDDPTLPRDSADPETGDPYDEEDAPDTDCEDAETEEDDADYDEEDAESEEDDEEPAPAQIDVMDGITPAPAPAENAAPKTTRKARGGKTK